MKEKECLSRVSLFNLNNLCVFIVIYSLKNCSAYGITALNQSGLLAKHFVNDRKKNEMLFTSLSPSALRESLHSILRIMNIMYKEIIFNVIYQVSDKNLKED